MAEQNCLFCRIIGGEIPAELIHQDHQCVAIRDINPQSPMHVLVIPRAHIESLNHANEESEALLGHLLHTGARIAKEAGHDSFRTVINTGAGAGQSVFHLHVHVLAGRSLNWPPG